MQLWACKKKKKGTTLYVIMFGYGREDHHIVTHIFETKYDGNEAFKGGFNRDSK